MALKKNSGITGGGRPGTGPGRSLAFEPLEDRRMLSLSHDPGGFDQGLLHTEADFDRMAAKVAAQEAPWLAGWQLLQSEGYAQLNANPRPLETVIRGGDGENYTQMHIDIQRSYLLAVQWKVSGDTGYADKAVEFLNAWQSTMTNLTGGSDVTLAAGIYGYEWANVAEIMRTYDGWAEADAANFGDWLALHFAPKSSWFLANHYGRDITHYWSNWDLASIAGLMAIGVYNDDQAMYDEAMDYFNNGGGEGGAGKWVYYVHDGNLGQWQESGRDQGHSTLGIALAGPIMQMAWNQGDDLFGYENNLFAAGAEYVSMYNLGEEVPFEQYAWGPAPWYDTAYHDEISPAARGVFRPGWELVYNHYASVKGIELPWTQQVITNIYGGVEGWSRNGDQFGFGTLMYSLDPFDASESKPSGLTAVNYEAGVKLNWWGAVYADSHNVYRSTSENGTYTKIATGLTDLLTYVDHGMPEGQYWYKVAGVIGGVETDCSDTVRISSAPELIAHLEFDASSGVAAADGTGNGNDGALINGASWVAGQSGNAVNLSGASQYVALPDNVAERLSDFSIATWVKLDRLDSWSRIFDFGDGEERYMFLTPKAGGGGVRFAIATNYFRNEDVVEGTAPLPAGQWVHVAVTLSGATARLYVNGELVGSNSEMNLNPMQLGAASQNWIGRSQYDADAYLNGKIDDFRIYNGALSTGAVYELATGNPPPAAPAAPATTSATAAPRGQINVHWSSTPRDYYTLKRATNADGPYYTIATQLSGTTYVDTGLAAGATYYYVALAVNEGGESDPSPVASVTALPPLPGVPGNLQGQALSATEIQLTWTAGSDAETYAIARSSTSGGPYTTIASGTANTSFVDSTLSAGETYHYVVTAVNAAGESSDSDEASVTAADLRLWLKFDEAAGNLAADSSGSERDGALINAPQWIAGRIGNAVLLDGVDDYGELPAGVVSGLTDFTISTWVSGVGSANWTRIFDFGSGADANMFLTPVNGSDGDLRFAIKNGGGEQQINTSSVLPSRGWAHVAVTMEAGVGVLYVNGNEVGRNNSMTITPADLGVTTQNYIGKSQYADPYLQAAIDDFRILNRALSAADVMAMATLPNLFGDFNRDNSVDAADYTLWRDGLGSAVPAFSGADGDGNGRIDVDDYSVWRANFGATGAAANAAVSDLADSADLALEEGDPSATLIDSRFDGVKEVSTLARPSDEAFAAFAAPAESVSPAAGPPASAAPDQPIAHADLLLYLFDSSNASDAAEISMSDLDAGEDNAEAVDAGVEALLGDLVSVWD